MPEMDSALHVDLAKPEAPTAQVLNSVLGQAATNTYPDNASLAASQSPEQDSKRSYKSEYATTTQPSLEAKPFKEGYVCADLGLLFTGDSMGRL